MTEGRRPTDIADEPDARRPWLRDDLPDLSDPQQDAFAVRELVTGLADLMRQAAPPFVVSISGAWGVGKSTVADNIRRILEADGGLVAYVDAWTTDLDNLRRTLIIETGAALRGRTAEARGADRQAIAASLDVATRNETTRTESGMRQARVADIARALWRAPLLIVLAVVATVMVAVLATVDTSKPFPLAAFLGTMAAALFAFVLLGSGLLVHSVSVATRRAAARESVAHEELFAAIVTGREAETARHQGRLGRPLHRIMRAIRAALHRPAPANATALVIVDNLDRLPSDDALRALSQIRSFVELPESRCLFLIPVDRRALTRHLAGALDERDEGAAADYLSKFFNLDLVLTDPEPTDLRDWALVQLNRSLALDEETAAITAQIVVSAAGQSPRAIRRIINGVSSRWRLLERTSRRQIDVPTVAFVEGLIVAFPNVLPGLVDDPRTFVTVFREIGRGGDVADDRLIELFSPPLAAADARTLGRFRAYLTRNQTLDLAQTHLRLALSLRENQIWKHVSDPGPLQEGLDASLDGSSLAAAWSEVPDAERPAARSALVDVLGTDLPFPQDAIAHLNAVARVIDPDAGAIRKLRRLSNLLDTLGRATDEEFALLTPAAAQLLAALWAGDRRLVPVADRTPAPLGATKTRGTGVEDAFHVLTALADFLSSPARDSARGLVAGLSDDLVAELFDPFREELAGGPVIEGLLGRLATWTASGEQLRAMKAVELLDRAAEAGWRDPERVTILAGVLRAQAATAAADPDARQVLIGIMRLLRQAEAGPEIDQLVSDLLSSPPTPEPSEILLLALALPVQDPVRSSFPGLLDRWIAGAGIGDVQVLALGGRATLRAVGYDPGEAILGRWTAGDGVEWAKAAASSADPPDATPVVAKLAASTALPLFPRLVVESVIVVEALDPAAATNVVSALQPAMKQPPGGLSVSDLESLVSSLVTLQRLGADTSPLVTSLEARAVADPALGALATAMRKLDEAGFKGLGPVAGALVRRGAAAGGIALDEAPWLVRATNGSNEARRVVTRLIESEPVDRVAAILPNLRALNKHPDVRLAAGLRAVGLGSPEEVKTLLESVKAYRVPTQPEYQAAIDELGQRWPEELTDFLLSIA